MARRGARRKRSDAGPGDERKASDEIRAFVRRLAEAERTALAVRDELYDGSWEKMREDLVARGAGRPYIFKLATRIEEDLEAIRKLSAFERRHKVNLSDYLGEGR